MPHAMIDFSGGCYLSVSHILQIMVLLSVITKHSRVFLHEFNVEVFGKLTLLSTKFGSISGISNAATSKLDGISGVANVTTSKLDGISKVNDAITSEFVDISVVVGAASAVIGSIAVK